MDAFEQYVEEHSNGTMQVRLIRISRWAQMEKSWKVPSWGNIQVGYANCSNVATVSG